MNMKRRVLYTEFQFGERARNISHVARSQNDSSSSFQSELLSVDDMLIELFNECQLENICLGKPLWWKIEPDYR